MKLLDRIRPELAALVAAAFVTRLWEVTRPAAVVFDEVYFKVFAGHYFDGRYFFDIHPPLGKLLLASWAGLMHLPAANLVSTTDPSVTLRYLPALAGALIIPVFWGILRRLGANRWFAALGALALLCDNALLTESRLILTDPLLILFGLSCVYFYLAARSQAGGRRYSLLALSALAGGAAASTKWTGLTALALVGFMWLVDNYKASWRQRLGEFALLAIIPVVLYTSVFWIHFKLLPTSGDGDAFMNQRFQATLVGNASYDPAARLGFWQKFSDLNVEMYVANQTLTATHPYASRWYTWPVELRPIYYWQGTAEGDRQGNIYLLGNPLVWWGILAAIMSGLAYAVVAKIKLRPATKAALGLTALAYVINFAPFIGVPRVMFLYHYFFAFIFSLAFAVLLWNDLAAKRGSLLPFGTWRPYLYAGVVVAIVAGFVFFAPLSYGWPLTSAELQMRQWLNTWR